MPVRRRGAVPVQHAEAETVQVHRMNGYARVDHAPANRVTLVMGVSERVDDGAGQGTLYNTILTFGAGGSDDPHG